MSRACITQRSGEREANMPDWRPEIRRRLGSLRLAPPREAEIVLELAEHLEDRYNELLAGGATKGEAFRGALAELSESSLLQRNLRRVVPPVNEDPVVFGAGGAKIMADL